MQPDTVAALMEIFKQLHAMIKNYKAPKFKNRSNFAREKGTFQKSSRHLYNGACITIPTQRPQCYSQTAY